MALAACSSNPPQDERHENFGKGLPQSHTETPPPPFETTPILKKNTNLGDVDSDGVINHRDSCLDETDNTQPDNTLSDNKGCAITFSQIQTIDLDIEFASGSSKIGKQYINNLKTLASRFKQNSEFILLIEGHTDDTGSRSGNVRLSKARADAIASVLKTQFNITSARLLTAGYGADRPIASNDTQSGRKQNRRMVAHLITRDRVLSKRFSVWTIELGDSKNSNKRLFEEVGA